MFTCKLNCKDTQEDVEWYLCVNEYIHCVKYDGYDAKVLIIFYLYIKMCKEQWVFVPNRVFFLIFLLASHGKSLSLHIILQK